MSELEPLLFANEAFYQAFADGDAQAMREVWSTEAAASCLHPGWGAIIGNDEVLKSWMAILANPDAPAIACRDATGRIQGDIGIVICFEQLGDVSLIATNLFHREGGAWKMIHHQAGPTTAVPGPETER